MNSICQILKRPLGSLKCPEAVLGLPLVVLWTSGTDEGTFWDLIIVSPSLFISECYHFCQ